MISLFYTGRITIRQKRFDLLIKLSELLSNTNEHFTLYVFGIGDNNLTKSLLKFQTKKFKIVCSGYVDDWLDSLPFGAIQIFTSDYEGCPLSLLEAYKNGFKKIIAIDSPGVNKYLSTNCLFKDINDMRNALVENRDLDNQLDLNLYFDHNRFKAEVLYTFDNILKIN
jgi:glycosyltransferase involved in cell wall biosynthesis